MSVARGTGGPGLNGEDRWLLRLFLLWFAGVWIVVAGVICSTLG